MTNAVPTPPAAPTIAVLGDGQLARMMHTAAGELGLSLRVLAAQPDASAAQIGGDIVLGDYRNREDVLRTVNNAAAVTFDHEHVPTAILEELIAAGVNVQPAPHALINAQDKLVMRRTLAELGVPVPDFAAIESLEHAQEFWDRTEGQLCLKARRGGYDGKGVWFPQSPAELAELVERLLAAGTPLMAERKVKLYRELSVLVARSASGEIALWPLTESVQENGVCAEAFAPAPQMSAELERRAYDVGRTVARELQVTGVLAVELFSFLNDQNHEDIAVNELAMRPHNTGHWTQDGAQTSQFEQHIRAVMDWPLGSPALRGEHTVMANILGAPTDPQMPLYDRVAAVMRRFPEAKIHLYGKEHRPGRKLGHINLNAAHSDLQRSRQVARLCADFIVQARWTDGYTADAPVSDTSKG